MTYFCFVFCYAAISRSVAPLEIGNNAREMVMNFRLFDELLLRGNKYIDRKKTRFICFISQRREESCYNRSSGIEETKLKGRKVKWKVIYFVQRS